VRSIYFATGSNDCDDGSELGSLRILHGLNWRIFFTSLDDAARVGGSCYNTNSESDLSCTPHITQDC